MTHQKTLTVYDDEGGIREFTAADVAELQQDCADLRARVAELERKVADKHEVATVDEICNAYESGVGHRGRPTAKVNPYRPGSELAAAYNIGAVGEREQQIANNDAEDDGS